MKKSTEILTTQKTEIAMLEKTAELEPVQLIETDEGPPILIYETGKGPKLELRYDQGTLWQTQAQMAELFGVQTPAISKHLANIFDECELDKSATVSKMERVASEGNRRVKRSVEIYNLDAIISVGYRVSSVQGTIFRRWATATLVQFATKGFVIDKERLKDPEDFDRIKELRETIREIRSSTANVYREVRRICTMCQDYDPKSKTAQIFFSALENKLLNASTSMTAPELLVSRADHSQPDMGLTTYPKDQPRQADALIANNYLTEAEARRKNRATTMLLDYFEEQLDLGKLVTMGDAEQKLNDFIKFNQWPLLHDFGKVSRAKANEHVKKEYKKFKALLA